MTSNASESNVGSGVKSNEMAIRPEMAIRSAIARKNEHAAEAGDSTGSEDPGWLTAETHLQVRAHSCDILPGSLKF